MIDKLLINLALSAGTGKGEVNIPQLTEEVVVQNALNLMYFLLGVIAVIVIIVAGITYATSSGNQASITKAKNMILYSVIGIAIVVFAYAITNFIIERF